MFPCVYPFTYSILANSEAEKDKEFQELLALIKEFTALRNKLEREKGVDSGKLATIPFESSVSEELAKLKIEMEKLKSSPEYKSMEKDQLKKDKKLLKGLGVKSGVEIWDEADSKEYKEIIKLCKRSRIPYTMRRDTLSGTAPWVAEFDTGALLYYEADDGWKDDSAKPEPYFIFFDANEESEGPHRFKAIKESHAKLEELKKLYEADKKSLGLEDDALLKQLGV